MRQPSGAFGLETGGAIDPGGATVSIALIQAGNAVHREDVFCAKNAPIAEW
ncbi:MAG: hypothetical protein O3B45_09815 [Bacteroidetes bacterium]|nr:hypothetical protein [Bacteroidota bacterium]